MRDGRDDGRILHNDAIDETFNTWVLIGQLVMEILVSSHNLIVCILML